MSVNLNWLRSSSKANVCVLRANDMYCLLTRKERFGTDSGAPVLENGMIIERRGEPRTENGFQLPSQYILKDGELSVSMKHMCTTAWTHIAGKG